MLGGRGQATPHPQPGKGEAVWSPSPRPRPAEGLSVFCLAVVGELSSSGGSRRPAEKTGFVGRTLRPLCRDSAPALDVCAVTSDERPQEHTVHVENPCTRNAALPTTPPALGLL